MELLLALKCIAITTKWRDIDCMPTYQHRMLSAVKYEFDEVAKWHCYIWTPQFKFRVSSVF